MIYLSIILYLITVLILYGLFQEKRDSWSFADLLLDEPYSFIYILFYPITIVIGLISILFFLSVDTIKEYLIQKREEKNHKNY